MKTILEMNDEELARWVKDNGPTPQELAERDAQRARDRLAAVERLREGWNAPKRHAMTPRSQEGVWMNAFNDATTRKAYVMAISGKQGQHKTQLGVEVMRRYTEQLRTARYESMDTLITRLQSASREATLYEEIVTLCRYSLLVIDEVTKCKESQFAGQMLFSIVNDRYNSMRETILISSLPKEQMVGSLGESIARRISESGKVYQL